VKTGIVNREFEDGRLTTESTEIDRKRSIHW